MRRIPLIAIALLVACSVEEPAEGPAEQVVITQLLFTRAVDGVSDGFDLDDQASSGDDATGCGKEDFESPDGEAGIDNATSGLIALLELTEAAALEPLIQQTINQGELLLVVELQGVDDPVNDDSVDVYLWQALGVPSIGTDGFIEPGQTIDRDHSIPPSIVTDVPLVDGQVIARGFEARLPITIFDASIDLRIYNAALRLDLHEDGSHSGVLAGALQYDGLLESLSTAAIDSGLQEQLPILLGQMADLEDENGVCRVMSANLSFAGTDAFFFPDDLE